MTAENPDMNAINNNIDEFGSLRNQMMKKQAAHIQDVRKLLNDEQRLLFDRKWLERGQIGEHRHGKMNGKPDEGAPGWKKGKHEEIGEGQQ